MSQGAFNKSSFYKFPVTTEKADLIWILIKWDYKQGTRLLSWEYLNFTWYKVLVLKGESALYMLDNEPRNNTT